MKKIAFISARALIVLVLFSVCASYPTSKTTESKGVEDDYDYEDDAEIVETKRFIGKTNSKNGTEDYEETAKEDDTDDQSSDDSDAFADGDDEYENEESTEPEEEIDQWSLLRTLLDPET